MGWNKQQLIEEAFAELGLRVDTFNIGPEKLQGALRRMDGMMALWNEAGIRLGYAMSSSPDGGDLSQDSGIPDKANEAVYLNLAIRIAPGFGKAISTDTRNNAKAAYNMLLKDAAQPPQQQLPNTLPRGGGNKPWRGASPFMPTPVDPLLVAEGGSQIEFE